MSSRLFAPLSAFVDRLLRRGTTGTLVFDGDSICAGFGAPPGRSLVDHVVRRLRFRGTVGNVSLCGSPVSERDRLFDETVAPLFDPANGPHVLFLHAGDNDVAGGADAEGIYAHLTSYVAKAQRQGWIIVLSTELPRFDFPAEKQAQLALFNAMLLENRAAAEAVVDFAGDPVMGGRANRGNRRLYIEDGVHPNGRGYAILAEATAQAMRPYFDTRERGAGAR